MSSPVLSLGTGIGLDRCPAPGRAGIGLPESLPCETFPHSLGIIVTVAAGGPADADLPPPSGAIILTVTTSSGSAVTFGIAGEGVFDDPAGLLALLTKAFTEGVVLTITANNAAAGRLTLTLTLTEATAETGTAPECAAAPVLTGSARVGEAVALEPGVWSGTPAPALAIAWLIDGKPVAGANEARFTPRPEDDGRTLRARVTATNTAGAAEAETEALTIAHLPPVVVDVLPDLVLLHRDEPVSVETAAAFEGAALRFAATGPGTAIDAETGRLSIGTDAVLEDGEITVTATNSGGTAETAFGLTVRERPAATTPPRLAGPAHIGEAVALEPGVWSGTSAPTLAIAWLIDGEPVAGAIEARFTPRPEDDGRTLRARVTATNTAGAAEAETEALTIAHLPPVVVDVLPDLVLLRGDEPVSVETAAAFKGSALRFAATGPGAAIDAATGRLTVATTEIVADAAVAVTATNSGGTAELSFRLTVAEPALAAPQAVGTLAEVAFEEGEAGASLSASAGFRGHDLVFTLPGAPAGFAVDAVSGLVTVPTAAPFDPVMLTVRATNASGAASQTVRVSVRANRSVFDTAARLSALRFVNFSAAPAGWSIQPGGFARLVTATTDRNHGDWTLARGDGIYRTLARWTHSDPTIEFHRPFSFTGRLRRQGTSAWGVRFEFAQRPVTGTGTIERVVEIRHYDGTATEPAPLATFGTVQWQWNTWYWIEVEFDGPRIRARFHPEEAAAPDWQIAATVTELGAGAFGPGSLPRRSLSTSVDIRRIEYRPLPRLLAAQPARPVDADWSLAQTEVLS